jgi:hypothetical protein
MHAAFVYLYTMVIFKFFKTNVTFRHGEIFIDNYKTNKNKFINKHYH